MVLGILKLYEKSFDVTEMKAWARLGLIYSPLNVVEYLVDSYAISLLSAVHPGLFFVGVYGMVSTGWSSVPIGIRMTRALVPMLLWSSRRGAWFGINVTVLRGINIGATPSS